ncbi:N-acetylmuramoyl-L-alanine amidase family protein [Metabacillus sp. RGM 3146]|uniref:N-acetylmuramoyl-L-alanine amidase family protein n=1 Tax=Metabacillus sp. RGM 3146 TaxID=3401092 RepID=UPI003B9D0B76
MLIVLDAGHGYATPGKRSVDGMKEFEFNRDVAIKLKTKLEEHWEIHILFSHSDKRDVPLKERIDFANEKQADLFVSIHANASGNGTEWNEACGIETYVHTSFPLKAFQLAQVIQRTLVKATGRKNRGVKGAEFYVLKHTKMPSVLIECGFMTNKEEAAFLKSESYREKCSKAIADSITEYFHLLRKV